MADYIYTMEIRLTPDQMKGVNLVQEIARAAGITLYLTGGAIRDIISGFTIRDLDFTVQGNPLKLQKDFERAGAQVAGHDEDVRTLFLVLPGNVRAEIGMARTEVYEKVGRAPVIAPASIQEDLRRRDFTVNAKALEKEEWLKVLHPHWSSAKVDTNGLASLMKTRQQMVDLGYTVDPSPAVMHFLTARLSDKDISDLRRQIPRKDLVEAWRDIEDHAKELAKRLTGKEAATPSRTWNLLSSARPEMILFLAVTAKHQTVAQKIKNFLTKWRQVQQRIPLPEMTELLITPALPEYPKIARDVFMLLLDGRLRSRTETLKFLKPFAPPPPPPQ